jgi:hypothetical protein
MPKIHNIGSQHFFQVIKFPVQWGKKVAVRGWTQEIDEPFRTTDNALIIRLPFYRALVLGKWTGTLDEETALERAIQRRDVTYDDFVEEKGWTPAPDEVNAESGEDSYY